MIGYVTNGPPLAHPVPRRLLIAEGPGRITVLTRALVSERVRGIEPPLSAWEADVLPLNYTRAVRGPTIPSPQERS